MRSGLGVHNRTSLMSSSWLHLLCSSMPDIKWLAERTQKICSPYGIRKVFTSGSTLRRYLFRVKPPTEFNMTRIQHDQETWRNGYRHWFPNLLRRQSSGGCRFNPDWGRNNTGILNIYTRLWLTESEQATPVDSIKDVVWSSVKVPEFDKHLKKAGGHIDRNVVEITKKKTIGFSLTIKIIKLRFRNSDNFIQYANLYFFWFI